ncbi:MAG: ACT domain-containing protein, partial [Ruminococcaceae bacterium]|nr:ACT domain-containing protein [Oscillospiraceae bacterium]
EDAVFPVRIAGIPINIKNTNAPEDTGTFIVPTADSFNKDRIITGISGKKGFSTINIEKDMLHNERGIGRRILEAVEKENMITEHLPSGIDTISVVISGDIDEKKKESLLNRLETTVNPDTMTFEEGFAIIAVVGRGMIKSKGTAARIFKACADNDINIRMIDQGSSELNIIIGVMEEDFEKAIKAIYNEFVG